MDFTREPIIQTVITPKEGCKIVVRSSKNSGQEEFFVDAVEVVSFGTAIFFRSLERPKSFLVPASDYEVLEVREARMVLKNVGIDRAIKIGGGRDAAVRGGREQGHEKLEGVTKVAEEGVKAEVKQEARLDKKRDRRRGSRRRRGRDEALVKDTEEEGELTEGAEQIELPKPEIAEGEMTDPLPLTTVLSSLLPPPPTLISETIARYRDNASFKSAFFSKEEQERGERSESPIISLEQPEYGSYEMSEEEEEEVYKQRREAHSGDSSERSQPAEEEGSFEEAEEQLPEQDESSLSEQPKEE